LAKQTLSRMQENRYKEIPKPELVGDVINGLCHQHYKNCPEQQKSDRTVHAAEEN